MATFEVNCPACPKRLRLSDEHRGKILRCPGCKTTFPANEALGGQNSAATTSSASPSATPHGGNSRPIPPPNANAPLRNTNAPVKVVRPGAAASAAPVATQPPAPTRQSASTARPVQTPATRSNSAAVRPTQNRPASGRKPPKKTDVWQDDNYGIADEDVVEDYDDPLDPFAGANDPYAAEELPQRSSRSAARRSSGVRTNHIVTVVVAMLGLSVVGGLAFVAAKFLPSLRIPGIVGNVVDMSYLPEETVGVVRMNVAAIRKAPVLQGIMDQDNDLKSTIGGPAAFFELTVDDIDSMTMGMWKSPGSTAELPFLAGAMPFAGNDRQAMMVVLRLMVAKNAESDLKLKKLSDHHGTPIYDAKGGNSAWMPNATTIVIANEDAVKKCIDRNGSQFRFPQLDFASSGDVVVAGLSVADDASASNPAMPPGMMANPFFAVSEVIKRNARAGAMSVSFGSEVDVTVSFNCTDSTKAAELRTLITQEIDKAKQSMAPTHNNAMLAIMVSKIKPILDKLTVSSSGSSVTLRTSVDRPTIDALRGI